MDVVEDAVGVLAVKFRMLLPIWTSGNVVC
jgi:hypothetical protein